MLSTQTDRYALSHDTGLLHPAWSTKLLHVFAEVALPTLFACTCLTLPAACSSAPGTRWTTTGWELRSTCCRAWSSGWRWAHLGFWPIKRPWLKHIEHQNYLYKGNKKHDESHCIAEHVWKPGHGRHNLFMHNPLADFSSKAMQCSQGNTNIMNHKPFKHHTLRVGSYGSVLVVCAVMQIIYMPPRHIKEKKIEEQQHWTWENIFTTLWIQIKSAYSVSQVKLENIPCSYSLCVNERKLSQETAAGTCITPVNEYSKFSHDVTNL